MASGRDSPPCGRLWDASLLASKVIVPLHSTLCAGALAPLRDPVDHSAECASRQYIQLELGLDVFALVSA